MTGIIAVFLSLTQWVLFGGESQHYYYPFSMYPPYEMMGTGLIMTPIIGLLCIALMLFITCKHSLRPLSYILFFAVCSMVIFINDSCFERHAIAMAISSLMIVTESLCRGLPRQHIASGALSVIVTICYFWTGIGFRMLETA